MIVFDLANFMRAVQLLGEIYSYVKTYETSPSDKELPDNYKEEYIQTLNSSLLLCQEMKLNFSTIYLERLINNPPEKLTYKFVHSEIKIVRDRILDELFTALTIQIPDPEAKYYRDEQLFGDKVANKFPKAVTDIQEAGKCFALGRYTSSVFHLMRVMELAVQFLGKKLKINFVQEKNWGNILDEVDRAIKQLASNNRQQKSNRNRYAEASAHLRAVKDAWRNNVMHPKDTYTEEEAERIFRNVKDFMVHLASKI